MATDGTSSVEINGSAQAVDSLCVPRHIAIIMDGNGRWANNRKLPRSIGHKKGSEAVREAIAGAIKSGVEFLTLYAFSTENWNRPEDEVRDLMGLLRFYLKREIKQLHKENVRLRVIGDRSALDNEIRQLIIDAEDLTKKNTRLNLVIALNYGGRQEIINAVKGLAGQVAAGSLRPNEISADVLGAALSTHLIPDPDLLVRTSGEQRLSNFLIWQVAYSELYFTDVLWPDFTEQHLFDAVAEYGRRDRRFGARPEKNKVSAKTLSKERV
jgi:undecaprenyl diphosphate synthase